MCLDSQLDRNRYDVYMEERWYKPSQSGCHGRHAGLRQLQERSVLLHRAVRTLRRVQCGHGADWVMSSKTARHCCEGGCTKA